MKLFNTIFWDRSIRFKLLFYFIFLILLPIVTLGIPGTVIYSQSMESETNTHTAQMIEQVRKNVEFYINDMQNIIYYISQEPEVSEFLKATSSEDPVFKKYEGGVRRILGVYEKAHPEIAGIMIVNSSDVYTSNGMYRIARDPLILESWYRQAYTVSGRIQLISKPIGRNITSKLNYSAEDVVSVTQAVTDPVSGRFVGVVLIDLKLNIIKKVIDDVKLGKNGFIYIMDQNGDIVYAPVNQVVYRVSPEWLKNTSDSLVKTIKNTRYQIIYKYSTYTKWKTIGVFSLNETLQEVTNLRNYSIVISFITLIMAITVALFFTRSIAKPISKMRSLMKKAEDGDLSVFFNHRYNDEIGQLGSSFNNMIGEIRNLINLVYTEQKSKREAELKTLQAQIKPHFLYNTLDTIQWMAQEIGGKEIVEVVCALTNLFRIGLSKGKEVIKVREELEHVRSYLVIQKARYADKLEYEINYDGNILEYDVIKLILQPLVENAIYQGIKEKRGVGRILIYAGERDGKLYFSVSDNGAGIRKERLEEIAEMLSPRKDGVVNPGFGIFNVNERIRLTYGSEYGLSFSSVYGEGTTVEIWHPLIGK